MASMEVIVGVGAIIDHTIGPLKRQMNYVARYRTNLKNLGIKVNELSDARVEVEMLVERDKRMGKRIFPTVEKWMEIVDQIIKEATMLLDEDCKAKAKWTPVKASYKRRKKARKLVERVIELLEQKERLPDSVSFDAHPQERWSIPTEDYEPLNSRISLVEQILNEFKNGGKSIIGVYGISGVGKTTFAKDVAREAKIHKFFGDVVLVLDVKQNQNLEEVLQKTIAQNLGLKFPEDETLDNRANRLFDRIKDKNVLVILDDVWEEIDLEKVGVRSGVCKILLTSRSRQVFGSLRTRTLKEFCLDTLNEEETWRLFEKTVGDVVQDYKIKSVAIKVAKRCGGLPVLVVTVAAALKNKNNIHVWKDAWRRLKNFGDKEERLSEKAYSGIEWSYNHLDDDEAKKLFLFCCGLATGSHFLSDLLKYCFGMGLFSNNIHTVEQVQNKLHTLVDKLKDSCLFLDGDSNKNIKLHDLVREVGVKIKGRESILSIRQGQELEWPDNDILKKCTMIDFVVPLPEKLECPNLEFFCIESDVNFQSKIPKNFFKEMKALKVLDLTLFKLSLLPSSFVALTNLKTLCLDRSILGDISLVGQLRNLEILSLMGSRFKQVSKEIGQLTHLRLLDLSCCYELEVIAPNVLSSLTSLEELKMRESFNKWDIEGNATLKKLSQLATLEIHIPKSSILPVDLFSNKLENFKILIGDTWDWSDVSKETSNNVFKLKLVGSTQLDKGLKRLLKKSESLYLDEMEGVDSIFCELDNEGFSYLKHLHIQNNPQIRYLILSFGSSSSNTKVFPMLESLVLENLSSIENVCSGPLNFEPFERLTSIKVKNCPNLKTLFSFSIAVGKDDKK